jgi:hypothetical protein
VVEAAEDLTPEWLSRALRRRVRDFDTEPIGTGQMGSSWRITLRYDGDPGPRTVVAKLAAGPEAARAQVAPGFAKEVGFYTVLAPTLDVCTPHCFYGAIADDNANFTLLLEDLAPATPGVQADSCTIEQATGAVRNLAALHASRWNDRSLHEHSFLSPVIPDHAERRRHEHALVAQYHSALAARGAPGYDLDHCRDDYRLGQLQGPLITVLGAVYATAERSESADRMFLAMTRRSCAAIRDLGTLRLLEQMA